jgi:hypothetical protein
MSHLTIQSQMNFLTIIKLKNDIHVNGSRLPNDCCSWTWWDRIIGIVQNKFVVMSQIARDVFLLRHGSTFGAAPERMLKRCKTCVVYFDTAIGLCQENNTLNQWQMMSRFNELDS